MEKEDCSRRNIRNYTKCGLEKGDREDPAKMKIFSFKKHSFARLKA
jgi:hypothetical protein